MDRNDHTSTDTDSERDLRSLQSCQLDLDRLLHVLSHTERRQTLRYLERHDGPIVIEELATDLADEKPAQDVVDKQERLTTLTYKHLPKLVSANLAERRPQDSIVATETTTDAVTVIDAIHDSLD